MIDDDKPMAFTGERFTPECVREIWYEHMHRYAFTLPLARGKRVLDAACGEGYGSALLAGQADQVLGLDIAPESIAHAQARYAGQENLAFRQADVTRLDDLPERGFDLIVCFETLEHVSQHDELLAGFARLLAPGGLLLVSTPDKAEYSDKRGFDNEFHVRELYRDEFEQLLSRHFAHHRLLAQKLLFQSAIWDPESPLGSGVGAGDAVTAGATDIKSGLDYPVMYYIAVCGQQELPTTPASHWFGDAGESVYSHYNDEIRKGIRAGERIAELERQLADAERKPDSRPPWWRRLFGA